MKKSWKKSVTWNLLAALITLTVTWVVTREIVISVTVGIVERALKLIAYPLHERFWEERA